MSWGYANRLEAQLQEEVRALLKKAAEADAEEEGRWIFRQSWCGGKTALR